ncbi:unnamed protein product [Candida verbasci]|uniref:Uncharacterized protein n=1 Tax=Candida verbasci TaxID=1227364 RepID=A0A9W4TUU5_9ASCO|nr:unnamed protein product [Candida verbasci]
MNRPIFRTFIRFNSTNAKQYIRKKPKFYDLLKTPTTKSLLLTLLCTSFVLDLTNKRKELEVMKLSYENKFLILDDILTKLLNNEKFDLAKELNLANVLTKFKYNSKIDIELDEQLEEFFKMDEEELSHKFDIIEEEETKAVDENDQKVIDTSKFL